jgi:hypothetical protein
VSKGDDPVDAELNRRLNDFAQNVILSALELMEQYCDRQGDSVQLAIGHPTGDVVLDQLLTELPRPASTRWLVATLRVQSQSRPGFMAQFSLPDGGQDMFYLVAEAEVYANDLIRAVPSFFCSNRGGQFRYFIRPVEAENEQPIVTQVHLMKHFLGHMEGFAEALAASL